MQQVFFISAGGEFHSTCWLLVCVKDTLAGATPDIIAFLERSNCYYNYVNILWYERLHVFAIHVY